jgi:hypothetical protein
MADGLTIQQVRAILGEAIKEAEGAVAFCASTEDEVQSAQATTGAAAEHSKEASSHLFSAVELMGTAQSQAATVMAAGVNPTGLAHVTGELESIIRNASDIRTALANLTAEQEKLTARAALLKQANESVLERTKAVADQLREIRG